MKPIAVVTTVARKKDARALARALVESGLAACAQISPIESLYTWKGKIEHGREYRVLFKTVDESYGAVESAIRDMHPYDLPAIHAFAFEHVLPAYGEWIAEHSDGG